MTAGVSDGQAMLTLKASQVRHKSVTILYGGDANHKSSTFTTARLS
jgi:hypothetical protein